MASTYRTFPRSKVAPAHWSLIRPAGSARCPQFPLTGLSLAPGCLALAIGLTAYFLDSPWMVWAALAPAVWAAWISPVRIVQLLLLTTPMFPVIRLLQDTVGAKKVSTKGVFLSLDDPLIVALLLVWICRVLGRRKQGTEIFPSALVWLAVVYPLVTAVNLFRLDMSQTTVSALYYVKWIEYALLIVAIPRVVSFSQVPQLLSSFRKLLVVAIVTSTLFAGYEIVESFRTGSYSSSARFPRASAFFGTLDPARFGASEDPVNFGVFAMIAGSIVLAMLTHSRRSGRSLWTVSLISSAASLLLCASRSPILAAITAFGRIHRIRSSQILLFLAAILLAGGITIILLPDMWSVTIGRFEAIGDWRNALESSAVDRVTIATNSPVFEIDQYWLLGHGFSSYRFIAEEHASRLTGGLSRSMYNFLLTAWYDAGPLGLILWITMFVQLDRRLRHISNSCPAEQVRALGLGLRGALWGLAVAAMFGEVLYSWRVMGFFYLCCGICLTADRFHRRQAGLLQTLAMDPSRRIPSWTHLR